MRVDGLRGLIAALVITLGGCSFAPYQQAVERDMEKAMLAKEAMDAQKQRQVVTRVSAPKLAGEELSVKSEEKLPAVFSQRITYMSIPRPLPVVLGEIGRLAGYRVRIQNMQSELSAQQIPVTSIVSPSAQQQPREQQISVDWQGDLRGLLDHIAMRSGMFWKFADGEIYFFRTETRTFHLSLPQGLRRLNASVGLGGSAGGSSAGGSSATAAAGTVTGSNTLTVDTNYSVDAYEAIRQGIYSILEIATQPVGAMGGSSAPAPMPMPTGMQTTLAPMPMPTGMQTTQGYVAVNPALGTVTVTATPPQLERVEQYIKSLNERFAKNVLIDLKVYSVDVEDALNAGAQLVAAYQQSDTKYNVTLTGNPSLQPDSGTPGMLTFSYTSPGSRWLGSQITLQALQRIGNVTLVTSGQVLAANGQPTPLQVAEEVTYLASSTTTLAGTGGMAMTTLTPGVKVAGLTGNFLPMVLADNRILLQFQINISNVLGIDTISSGGSTIQTPRVAVQSLQQQVYVRDGETIVLFGFERGRNDLKSDTGLGGTSKNAKRTRSMMVLVMEVYHGK